jgi:hypothetical protein
VQVTSPSLAEVLLAITITLMFAQFGSHHGLNSCVMRQDFNLFYLSHHASVNKLV